MLIHTVTDFVLTWLDKQNVARMSFPRDSVVENLPANVGDAGSITGLGKALAEGNPLQYSCLGNLMDRQAWLASI